MKKMSVFSIVLSVSMLLVGSTNVLMAGETRGVKEDTITIGVIMDQTGPAAPIGIPYTAAIRNYFKHINDTGGINGRRVELIPEDDGYSIPRSFAAFKKLVFKDRVIMIIGCGGTGQNTALFPQIEKNKVPVIAVSWSWTMTDPVKRYVFTPGNDNKDEIKIIMDYIVKTMKAKNPRIALVGPDVEYAKSGFKVLQAKAKEYNLDVVGREIQPFEALDASTQVLSLRKKKATHVITLGMTLTLIKTAKMLNYWPVFFGSFHALLDEWAKISGGVTKNLYGAAAFGSWFDDTAGIAELKKISLLCKPNMEPPDRYYVKGWITSRIAHEGMKRAGKNLTPDTFVNALETMKNYDMMGLTGPISYSAKDHKGNSYARLYKANAEKGYFLPVTGWVKSQ
ncbi:MAG: ABC transporter substrate-binding protein [Thermodesulfobacteriota bacterium]|nr:ABC transporter substrate-binding protein [Thermodesulfobacteriota bacterium]